MHDLLALRDRELPPDGVPGAAAQRPPGPARLHREPHGTEEGGAQVREGGVRHGVGGEWRV